LPLPGIESQSSSLYSDTVLTELSWLLVYVTSNLIYQKQFKLRHQKVPVKKSHVGGSDGSEDADDDDVLLQGCDTV
jgi:hypothetical protein